MEGLVRLHRKGMVLDPLAYRFASASLADDDEGVRLAALQLLVCDCPFAGEGWEEAAFIERERERESAHSLKVF